MKEQDTAPPMTAIWAALDATWPAAQQADFGPWDVRSGPGGRRVSCATLRADAEPPSVAETHALAAHQRALGQPARVMVKSDETALADALKAAGFAPTITTNVLAGSVGHLAAAPLPDLASIDCTYPLARAVEIWNEMGTQGDRLEIMQRVAVPKRWLLARRADRPAGVGFVAASGNVAMLHALAILPDHRRKGVATGLLTGAARWAERADASHLVILAEADNQASNALAHRADMCLLSQYSYWEPS